MRGAHSARRRGRTTSDRPLAPPRPARADLAAQGGQFTHTDISIYLSIYLSICLSIYLSVCLSVCLSVYPSIHPSIHLSISTYMYISNAPGSAKVPTGRRAQPKQPSRAKARRGPARQRVQRASSAARRTHWPARPSRLAASAGTRRSPLAPPLRGSQRPQRAPLTARQPRPNTAVGRTGVRRRAAVMRRRSERCRALPSAAERGRPGARRAQERYRG
jgi:hypothetical protein